MLHFEHLAALIIIPQDGDLDFTIYIPSPLFSILPYLYKARSLRIFTPLYSVLTETMPS